MTGHVRAVSGGLPIRHRRLHAKRRRSHRTAALAVALALAGLTGGVVAGVVAGVAGGPSPGRTGGVTPDRAHRRAHRTAPAATARRRARRPEPAATFPGPYGVESAAVVAENRKAGTTAWRIPAGHLPGTIDGFVGTTDALDGQHVGIYVSTTAPTYRIVAYRMGWYGGDGGREVWASGTLDGTVQPPCPVTPQVNMVSCANWRRSLLLDLTAAFVPGDYLLKLVGSGGQQGYLLLTVSPPTSHATYLVIARSMTEEGWNTYGGDDLYQGTGPCTFGTTVDAYPACNRARVVSFDRPYAAGDGAADFLTNELPLVELVERHGLDVDYTTDVAVSTDPSLLLGHRAILSLGHDETWTYPELSGVQKAVASGENVAFLSAAAVVRHARLQASPLGPARELVDYRDAAEDPLDGTASPMVVTGNTWASPPTDVAATSLVGELYSGFLDPGRSVPFVVHDARSWIFAGTGLHDGAKIPNVVASDIDHVAPASPMPADLQVLGHSPVPLSEAYTNQGDWSATTYADMTYFTDPASGAGVLDTGTVNWVATLDECPTRQPSCPTRLTDQITGNLLRLFGQGPAGRTEPSRANWRAVLPAGS
ncbi:MAG: hypothetical protein M0T71_15165 [Actinomycetota bacterium]|nr:hypothetical protein [Actinomycetota bacterium]